MVLARELSLKGEEITQLCKPIWSAWPSCSWGVIDSGLLHGPFSSAEVAFVTIRSSRAPGVPLVTVPFMWCVDDDAGEMF